MKPQELYNQFKLEREYTGLDYTYSEWLENILINGIPSNLAVLKAVLRHGGYVAHLFSRKDVEAICNVNNIELSPEQITQVMLDLERVDSNEGINWDTIKEYCENVNQQ